MRSLLLAAAAAVLAMPAAQAAGEADTLALGRRLFTTGAQPACATCHALKDAGSEGAIGPALDELKPDAQRVATAVRNGIGAMPAFQGRLSDAEIDALAKYVAAVAGR